MPKVFADLDRDDMDLFNQVLNQYRPDLIQYGVKIKPLMVKKLNRDGEVSACLKLAGYPVAGLARVTTHKQRFFGYPDGIIELEGAGWANKCDESKKALIHHELHHFEVKMDPEADNDHTPQLDDLGRPKLVLRPDDWMSTGFYYIIEKHGEYAGEYQTIRAVHIKMEEAARRFARAVAS
jgi:hypothetical protein